MYRGKGYACETENRIPCRTGVIFFLHEIYTGKTPLKTPSLECSIEEILVFKNCKISRWKK